MELTCSHNEITFLEFRTLSEFNAHLFSGCDGRFILSWSVSTTLTVMKRQNVHLWRCLDEHTTHTEEMNNLLDMHRSSNHYLSSSHALYSQPSSKQSLWNHFLSISSLRNDAQREIIKKEHHSCDLGNKKHCFYTQSILCLNLSVNHFTLRGDKMTPAIIIIKENAKGIFLFVGKMKPALLSGLHFIQGYSWQKLWVIKMCDGEESQLPPHQTLNPYL